MIIFMHCASQYNSILHPTCICIKEPWNYNFLVYRGFFCDKIGIIIDKVSEYTVEKYMENNPIGMPEILSWIYTVKWNTELSVGMEMFYWTRLYKWIWSTDLECCSVDRNPLSWTGASPLVLSCGWTCILFSASLTFSLEFSDDHLIHLKCKLIKHYSTCMQRKYSEIC